MLAYGEDILLKDIIVNIGPVAEASVDSFLLPFHTYGSCMFYNIECCKNIVSIFLKLWKHHGGKKDIY